MGTANLIVETFKPLIAQKQTLLAKYYLFQFPSLMII